MKRILLFIVLLTPAICYPQVTTSTWATYTFLNFGADTLKQNPVRALEVDGSDTLWAGLASGVVKGLTDSTFYHYLTTDSSLTQNSLDDIRDLVADTSGNLWLATGAGLVKLPDHSWASRTNYKSSEKYLLNGNMRRIVADTANQIWAGHGGSHNTSANAVGFALYGTAPNPSTDVDYTDSFPGTTVYATAIDSDYNVWVGTDSGASVFMGVWFNYTTDDGLPDNRVMAIAADDSGYIWFGTPKGAVKFDGDTTWTDVSDSIDAHGGRNVFAISFDLKQYIAWFATDSGLVSYKPSTLYPYSPYSGYTYTSTSGSLPSDLINDIAVDADTTVWIATPEGLVRLKEVRE